MQGIARGASPSVTSINACSCSAPSAGSTAPRGSWRHGASSMACSGSRSMRRRIAVRADPPAASSASSLTPEEEEAYRQILDARKQKKAAEMREYKRRANFDPLARRAQVSAPDTGAAVVGSSGPSAAAAATTRRLAAASASQRRPPPVPTGERRIGVDVAADGGAGEEEDEEPDEAEFEAAALRFMREEQREAGEAEAAPAPVRPQQQPADASPPGRRRTLVAPGDFKPGAALPARTTKAAASPAPTPAPSEAAAAPPADLPTAAAPNPSTSQSLPQRGKAPSAAGTGSSSQTPARRMGRSQGLDAQLTAALAAAQRSDPSGGEALDAGVDWDTLIAGESFEKYLAQLQKEDEEAAMRRQRAAAGKRRADGSGGPGASGAAAAAAAAGGAAAAAAAAGRGRKSVTEDEELDQLLKFLELVDESMGEGEEGEGEQVGGRAASLAASSGSSTTGFAKRKAGGDGRERLEDDIDWGVLEKVFLGEGWDKELRQLAIKAGQPDSELERDEGNAEAAGGEGSDDETPLWGDEVTTLLLGLVSMSHERYLNKPILDSSVSEEERAQAFWQAPFVLLVQDDSKEAMLEYANSKALELLGHRFEDIYDLSSFDVIDADDAQQQEWLWTTSEVEDKLGKHTVVPSLRLRGAGGTTVTALNAVVFRVDNLQGDAMGQAILIHEWRTEPNPSDGREP